MRDPEPRPAPPAEKPPRIRGKLFRKYVALFLSVVCIALLTSGLSEIWFSYQEHKASLIRIQREQAEAAAAKIGQFIKEIDSQIGWTTQLPWSAGTLEQRRFDGLRLLRQVPAITELAQLDATGRLASCHGCGRKPDRLFPRAEIRRCACPHPVYSGASPSRI